MRSGAGTTTPGELAKRRDLGPKRPERSFERTRRRYPLSGLYGFYAQLAVGPQVRQLALRGGPLHGDYGAFVSVDGKHPAPSGPSRCNQNTQLATCTYAGLNLGASLVIEATARTKNYATATASRVSRGLRTYVRSSRTLRRYRRRPASISLSWAPRRTAPNACKVIA